MFGFGLNLKKKFKTESEQFHNLRMESIHAQMKYDDLKAEDAPKDQIESAKTELEKANARVDSFKGEYARKIYQLLVPKNPVLKRQSDSAKVSWTDAFGHDFEQLSKPQVSSLIALVEENGGQYRL